MVFQVDSEPIADMNWFWLDKRPPPKGGFFSSNVNHQTGHPHLSLHSSVVLELERMHH